MYTNILKRILWRGKTKFHKKKFFFKYRRIFYITINNNIRLSQYANIFFDYKTVIRRTKSYYI